MKKKVIFLLVILFTFCTGVSAATIINSRDVIYDNSKSGMESINVQAAVDELYSAVTDYNSLSQRVSNLENNFLDKTYPVGSVYISTTDDTIEKVKQRFGGKWEVYAQGRTLIGVGSTTDSNGNALVYEKNKTGGTSTTSLSVSNIPSHSHSYTPSGTVSRPTFTGTTANTGANNVGHTHGIPALSGTTSNSGNHRHNLDHGGVPNGSTAGWGLAEISKKSSWAETTTYSGTHSHTVTTNASTTGGNSANHVHSYTPSGTVSQPTFTGTTKNTGSTGSGTSFNIQNPYITVYMYKRVE